MFSGESDRRLLVTFFLYFGNSLWGNAALTNIQEAIMSSMKRISLLLIAVFFIGTNGYAEEILITGNAFRQPKIWMEGKKPTGILVDIMNYVGKELGTGFELKLSNWARAYNSAVNGESGIVGISKNEERFKLFDYSEPLYYDEVILVVKLGNEFKFEKNEDLTGKKIGVCRGCSFGPKYEDAKKLFEIFPDNKNSQRLKLLLAERTDAAVFSPGEASLILALNEDSSLSREQFSILKRPIARDPNYLAFAKEMNMKAFLSEFNQVLKKGYETGAIQTIIKKY